MPASAETLVGAPGRRGRARAVPAAAAATWARDRALPLALVAIGALYLGTRLGLVWRFPPFWDETGYGEWAKAAAASSATRFASMVEGKEPLTSWLGALWIKVGVPYLTAVRLVSVVSGAISLAMLWLVGKRVSRPTALVAMALYAGLPLFVVHDALGLMEPTVTAAALCALYLAMRMAERPSLDSALLLGAALGAGVLTKESGRFAIVMVPLALLVFDWRGTGLRRRLLSWVGGYAVALAVCLVMYSVLLLSPLWPSYVHGGDGLHHSISSGVLHAGHWIAHSLPQLAPGLLGYLGPVVLGAALVGAAAVRGPARRPMAVVALWGFVPFVGALLLANNGYPRYWLNALAPLMVPAAAGLTWLARAARARVAPGTPRLAVGAALVALALTPPAVLLASVLRDPSTAHYPGLDDGQYVTSWASGNAWRSVAQDLELRSGGANVLVGIDRARPLAVFLAHPDRVREASIGTPATAGAQFLIKNWSEPLDAQERAEFRLVRRFPRPRGGLPILLYARR